MCRTLILFFLSFLCSHSANGIGNSNGYSSTDFKELSKNELLAVYKSINGAKCIYGNMSDPFLLTEWIPETFDIPDPCGSNSTPSGLAAPSTKTLCTGTVICRSAVLTFSIEKANCWATDKTHCPPPGKCALQSMILSKGKISGFEGRTPVYNTTKPAKVVR